MQHNQQNMMNGDITSIVGHLKSLSTNLLKEGTAGTQRWTESLDQAVSLCNNLPACLPEDKPKSLIDTLSNLETISVSLWNFSVAYKAKQSAAAESHAKLRHVAFCCLECYCSVQESESIHRRLIMMGLKTGRAWLDCKEGVNANKILLCTEKCLMKTLARLIDSAGDGNKDLEGQRRNLEQDHFTLLCHLTEACIASNKPDDALQHMMMAKDILSRFPDQGAFLSMLCYNIAVELFQAQQFDRAIIWLRESYDLGKGQKTVGPKNQARTLRLLANVYLDVDAEKNKQSALNAISLANTEHSHPAGVFLKLKILLLHKEQDDVIKRAAEDLLRLSELSIDLCLHTLQLVNSCDRVPVLLWLIEEMLRRFDKSPDIGKLLIANLEALVKVNMLREAKHFVEYCIKAHHTGQKLEVNINRRFHVILWEQAATAYDGEHHEEALDWYNYSLSLYTQTYGEDPTLGKLHRNRANCYMILNKHEQAQAALDESLKFDPCCLHTQFVLYKLAVQKNDDQKAYLMLKQLCDLAKKEDTDRDMSTSLIALAGQMALEHERSQTALLSLEHLSDYSPDPGQVLTALRCLVRLKLNNLDNISKLKMLTDTLSLSLVQQEASWFMKIAWNIALKLGESPDKMKDLYILCFQFLKLCVQEESTLSRQITCLLMCAAACLQIARNMPANSQQKRGVAEECIKHLDACMEVKNKESEQTLGHRSKEADVLMLLYEFEARLLLGDPVVENVLERAITVCGSDPKVFETFAAIACEPTSINRSIGVRALKVAIRKHLNSPQPDMVKCSKLFHSLVQLYLSSGSSPEVRDKEDTWHVYMELLQILSTLNQGQYPEIEIVWLMTKAWNHGINFYSSEKLTEAEKWCGVSMSLLKYLDVYRSSYEEHMTSVYGDILAKMDTSGAARKPIEV